MCFRWFDKSGVILGLGFGFRFPLQEKKSFVYLNKPVLYISACLWCVCSFNRTEVPHDVTSLP